MVKLVFLLKDSRKQSACHRRDGRLFRARRQVNSHHSQIVFFFSVSKSITNVRTIAESFSYSKKQALNQWFSTLIAQEDHLGSLKKLPIGPLTQVLRMGPESLYLFIVLHVRMTYIPRNCFSAITQVLIACIYFFYCLFYVT